MMPLARLSITQFKVDIAPGARIGTLSKAYKAADITGKWNATSWAQGMAKKAAKAKMTDMDRFKMMVARKTVSITTTPPTLPPLARHISEVLESFGKSFWTGRSQRPASVRSCHVPIGLSASCSMLSVALVHTMVVDVGPLFSRFSSAPPRSTRLSRRWSRSRKWGSNGYHYCGEKYKKQKSSSPQSLL
jgi:hypothetical protein